jgi:heme A synthase
VFMWFMRRGCQGLIGWWMVKSGLEMDPKERREIRVSPYRLATHLGMAFTTYSLLIWTGRHTPPAIHLRETLYGYGDGGGSRVHEGRGNRGGGAWR